MTELSYWQRWRRAHPEYVMRERERGRVRRREGRRGDRTAEYRARVARRVVPPPIPDLHTGHPVLEWARRIIRDIAPMAVLKSVTEWNREDARSEAVLAILEGRDPEHAALQYLRDEKRRQRLTMTLIDR